MFSNKKPLPIGMTDFHKWADNIVQKAGLPKAVPVEQQKYVLSDCICQLGSQEAHKEDAYFVNFLRKIAANQVASAYRQEIYEKTKAEKAASDAVKQTGGEPFKEVHPNVLEESRN